MTGQTETIILRPGERAKICQIAIFTNFSRMYKFGN